MSLETLYRQVKNAVDSLDFSRIWPGFEPLKFALYDSEACFFNGSYIEKTDDFCANTSIDYRGEQIAIWMVTEETEIPVLASKIVHEMFHGYQTVQGWDCWPDEMEALYRYRYSAENLSLKLRENELLLSLLDRFDTAAFRELLSLRKLRSMNHAYEFTYESKVEEIEGTANYVEWQALKQLDEKAARAVTEQMRQVLTKPEYLFPIRISCYCTGALMIHAFLSVGVDPFGAHDRPVIATALKNVTPSGGDFPGKETCFRKVSEAVAAFTEESEAIVRSALEKNDAVLEGPLELGFVNIYNARCWNGYLTSTYFLMYRDGQESRTIQGDFVIRMRDGITIDRVYRWNP